MGVMAKHGVSATTPENVLFGAGTYHKNLTWDSASKKWAGAIIGATSGGGKLAIEGEYVDIELDGALVPFKGQTVKQGGKASMEANFAEITGDTIRMGTNFKVGESEAEGYTMYVDKADIEDGDYVENFGFVGKTANGKKNIIVIFDYALCKSAFEVEGKNKEQSVLKLVMEAYAENDGESGLDTLPVRIYYPDEPIV